MTWIRRTGRNGWSWQSSVDLWRLTSNREKTFNNFFNILEPTLPHMFPGSVHTGADIYVWQLLAAIGVSASPDQQQRLVLAVKDRVLDTVNYARTLPPRHVGPKTGQCQLVHEVNRTGCRAAAVRGSCALGSRPASWKGCPR